MAWGARPVGAGRVDKEANDANTGHPKKVMAVGPRCLFYSTAHLTRPMRRQPGFHGGGFGIPIPMATEDNEGTHVSACPRTHLRAQAPPRHTLTHARARARVRLYFQSHAVRFVGSRLSSHGDSRSHHHGSPAVFARMGGSGARVSTSCCKGGSAARRPLLFFGDQYLHHLRLLTRPPHQPASPPHTNFPAPPAN